MPKPHIDDALARQLAVEASVDPRSIKRAAAGLPVRGLAGYRARAALRAVGLLPEFTPEPRESGGES